MTMAKQEVPPLGTTYEVGVERGQDYILCLVCKAKSFHPEDIKQRYCGRCHQYHPIAQPDSV